MIAGLVASMQASAQTATSPPAAAASQADAQTLEKVVVTSNKRREKQRDVAGTVSVLDGADLERRSARDQEDTLKLAPGVQFNKGDISSNSLTIRGIGTTTSNEGGGGQQGTVGEYLEDVPLAAANGKGIVWDPITFDMDRIEILRGPQGVLFGSGSLGGAIRYLFNKPRFGQFEASIKGEYAKASGGDSKPSEFAMLNVPLGEQAAARAVVFDRRDPGYIDNLGTQHKDANDVHQKGGRLLVSVKPASGLIATLVASTQDTTQDDTFSVSPDPTKLEHTAPNDSHRHVRNDFYSLTADWNLGTATLTSISGYWQNKTDALIDDTELFASIGVVVPQVYRPQSSQDHAASQEVRLASNPGGPFNYVVGLFYQRSHGTFAGKQIDPSATFGVTDLVDLTTEGGGTEKAAFADTEYAFGGGWSAGVGARYYRTTTEGSQAGTIFGAPSPFVLPDSNDHGVTPRVSVKYQFGDNMWYALASKGYRYGGSNAPPTVPATFKSDSLWNYETGVRLAPGDGLQIDLTAFLLEWRNAQFTFFNVVNMLPNSGISNVGKARSIGLEAALRYRFNTTFDASASAALTDAKTKTDVMIPSGGPTTVDAPSGSRLPGTPILQTALQGNYHFTAPMEWAGRANLTYTHVGSRVLYLGNNKPADAYDTVDLGVDFSHTNWTVAAGITNVTNEKGVQSITGAPAGVGSFAQYFLQRPRTFLVSLRYDY